MTFTVRTGDALEQLRAMPKRPRKPRKGWAADDSGGVMSEKLPRHNRSVALNESNPLRPWTIDLACTLTDARRLARWERCGMFDSIRKLTVVQKLVDGEWVTVETTPSFWWTRQRPPAGVIAEADAYWSAKGRA